MDNNNDTRDHQSEHKEEKYKFDYDKMSKFTSYPQMPMGPYQMQGCQMQNCPMYGNPAYCPMFQGQTYNPIVPGQMRDDDEDVDVDFGARPFRPRPFYPRPFYPRPYFYPRPFYPPPYFYPRPYFYPGINPLLFLLPFFF